MVRPLRGQYFAKEVEMKKAVGCFAFTVLCLGGLSVAFSADTPKVPKTELTLVEMLDVEAHIPAMQKALASLTVDQQKVVVNKLLVSKDLRRQYAVTLMNLDSIKPAFHGPSLPPPPCAPCGPPQDCPCLWWDILCLLVYDC